MADKGADASGLSGDSVESGAEKGDLAEGSQLDSSAAEQAEAPDPYVVEQAEMPDPYAAFCAEYDLSPRESEVFRLWVTGHGLKYIQNALFVSESTVKSHLRSIYRKCDTHNRDEIIALFEREAPSLG